MSLGHIHMRELQYALRSQQNAASNPPSQWIPLMSPAKLELLWWGTSSHLLRGAPMCTLVPDFHLFTDASREGWGAHHVGSLGSHLASCSHQCSGIGGRLSAIRHWWRLIQNSTVLVATDNSTVVSYLNKGGGGGGGAISRYPSGRDTFQVASLLWWTFYRAPTSSFPRNGLSTRRQWTASFSCGARPI